MELSMEHFVRNRLAILRNPTNFITFRDLFIDSILIDDRIFLRSESRNYIACHQILIYGSGYETSNYACLKCVFIYVTIWIMYIIMNQNDGSR